MAYTMFDNYHHAAQEFAGGNLEIYGRFMLILNKYAIDGEELQDLNAVEKLFFTTVKPSIDKSLKLSAAGKKGGSMGKSTGLQATNNGLKKAYNELELELEKELETENRIRNSENNPNSILHKKIISIISNFAERNGLNFEKKTINELFNNLSKLEDPALNLEQQLQYVKSIYPNKTGSELTKLFISSLKWKNRAKPAEQKSAPAKPAAPKICTYCNSKLQQVAPDLTACPTCEPRVFWELIGNVWKCSRD